MHDLKAFAVRRDGVIHVALSGMLPDTCHEASVRDKYPGGSIVYVKDPGAAQVFVEERAKPGSSICLFVLVPWFANVQIPDSFHTKVDVYVNGSCALTVDVREKTEQYQVISLIGEPPRGCSVIPADAFYPMIYQRVFGPASRQDCEAWRTQHCQPPTFADTSATL